MTLRCKPGDLAIIIGATVTPQLLGHIVEVVGPWTRLCNRSSGGFIWEIKYPDGRLITTPLGGDRIEMWKSRPFLDLLLLPIRPSEGQDETLQWAPVPEKEIA